MSGDTDLIARIAAAADAIDQGDTAAAQHALDGLDAANDDRTPDARLARLFAAGLRARLDSRAEGGGNLYTAELDDVDMIGAFDTLVSTTPFIRFAYAAANTAIAALPGDALHIVDIGIGEGTQWPSLIDAAGGRQIRLTGIDVPMPGQDPEARLRAVGDRLHAHAAASNVEFEFAFIAAGMEDVTAGDLALHDSETLAVNMALALHHTSTEPGNPTDAGTSARDDVIARLHSLSPALVALVEPDSEHDRLPFRPRVDEAMRHYGAVFRALDTLVPADNPARAALEEHFFGREIINVVGFEGAQRVERHHRHEAWGERFRHAGFTGVDLAPHAQTVAHAAGVAPPSSVTPDDGMLVLAWEGTPLLSASAWTA